MEGAADSDISKMLNSCLDDLISQNITSTKGGGGGGRANRSNKSRQQGGGNSGGSSGPMRRGTPGGGAAKKTATNGVAPYYSAHRNIRNGNIGAGGAFTSIRQTTPSRVVGTVGPSAGMHYTVRVTGLKPGTDINDMKSHFGCCGKVVGVKFVADCVAFVAFNQTSACTAAIRQLDQSKLKGVVISVEGGRPIPPSPFPQSTTVNSLDKNQYYQIVGGAGHPLPGACTYNQFSSPPPFGLQSSHLRTVTTPHQFHPITDLSLNAATVPQTYGQHFTGAGNGFGSNLSMCPVVEDPYGRLSANIPPTKGGESTVLVTRVPCDLTAQEIQDAFSCVGTVLRTEILRNSLGRTWRCAAITFDSPESAEEAVKRFDGGDLNQQQIRVIPV